MIRAKTRHTHRLALCLPTALALACALAPPASARSAPAGEDGALSPRLTELARPAVSSLPDVRQARRLDLAADGPGSLVREGDRVLVDVRYEQGALAGLEALRAVGARIVAASGRYQTVTVAVAPEALPALADAAGVAAVSENRAPLLRGAEGVSGSLVGSECEGGSILSEGVPQLRVDQAHSKYGVDGSGVTVGVLSDSYDKATEAVVAGGPVATHAAEDVASNDLPGAASSCAGQTTPVRVLEDFTPAPGEGAADEGRAMLQIVHDVAPKASLAFATAFKSELSFAQNIERLAKSVASGGAGAKVIVDDVIWFGEPFFQDGPVANAVNKVTGEGVSYFSSAGNDNLFEGSKEISSWEAPSFRDSGGCPAGISGGGVTHCMDFNPGAPTDNTFGLTVPAGRTLTVDLQWAEPWSNVQVDLDAYLLDSGGSLLAAETQDNVGALKKPVEVLQWENDTGASRDVRLAINRCAGATCNPAASGVLAPRLKLVILQGSGVTKTEYPSSSGGDVVGPTIFGHTGATGAVSVAAVPFGNSATVETYSSRGPVTHYFGPVGTVPAVPLGAPETIAKPNLAATDCGATTFFASYAAAEATWRFCGTSAAAPHAAAVAALGLQAKPAASVAEVRGALTSTARPVGAFGASAVGAGLIDADAAVHTLLPPSAVTILSGPGSRTADSTPTFAFEVSPPAATTCFLDGVSQGTCASPYTVASPLADGPHSFKAESSGGSASYAFTVDTVAPQLSFDAPGASTADPRPAFVFSASEPAAFTCALDGAAPKACTSPYVPPAALADGTHALAVTAKDQVGNGSTATRAVTVDTAAPLVTISDRPAALTADTRPTFRFSASEPAAFTCALDGAPSQPCDSPFLVPAKLDDGAHVFAVLATDLVGHSAGASAAFTVDTRRPNTFFAKHPPKTIRTRKRRVRVSFGFGSNEPGAVFICKVDRDLLRYCPARISRRLEAGRHVVVVKARDAVGNVDGSPAVFKFQVKRAE